MDSILFRIRKVFSESNKSQTEISKMIGKTPQYIWRILNIDTLSPSESVIRDICREFNVNEIWLRTGVGDMFAEMSKKEKVAKIVGKSLREDDEFVQNVFIALGELTPDEWNVIKKFVDKIKNL